ncbi:MAG: LacI family DNA-binding transcriptional regulator [Ignavibacteriales bacterium]|nr:LacI family DNA-binding transcriptional regulator [Ignavibacteriales bacterium]MBI3786935.1 LacI family DNA-binding transcriptional regulator [Ignavibacteriales bacterium]
MFNNHPSVSDETRARVLKIAKRHDYRPHPYARGLARQRTNSILAVIPFFTTFFFLEILQGVQSKLKELDCDLILYGVNHPDQVEESLRRNALRNRVDGVLFFSMSIPDTFADQYLQMNIPVVLIDTYHKNFDSLTVENSLGAFLATNHLISLGHKRIGMLNANIESLPARERFKGFQRALREAGITLDPMYVRKSTSTKLDGFTREEGYKLIKEFIAYGSEMPTAIFVSSDIQAIGALAALTEAGLRCPEDISIVGFDDIEFAGNLGLTTIRQPMAQMGAFAAERLAERMSDLQLQPIHNTFVPSLVIRKSTAPPLPQKKQKKNVVSI